MPSHNDRNEPVLTFATARELETHLSGASAGSAGFSLKLAKAGAPTVTIGKGDAIEVALCWGWIDGQLAKFDEHHFLVRMTPRRPGSRWSAKNRAAAIRLAQAGRLQPPGLAEVEAAKADGRGRSILSVPRRCRLPVARRRVRMG